MPRAFLLFALVLLAPFTAQAGLTRYVIDQQVGMVGFTVSHLGLFSSSGSFGQFAGELLIDLDSPDKTRIDVNIDAASVDMAWPDAIALLRSPDYFDTAQFSTVHFRSTDVAAEGADHYLIYGMLSMRGVTRPETLDAMLVSRRVDPVTHVATADVVAKTSVRRSAFGMNAGRAFISDMVAVQIRVHIVLPVDHAG